MKISRPTTVGALIALGLIGSASIGARASVTPQIVQPPGSVVAPSNPSDEFFADAFPNIGNRVESHLNEAQLFPSSAG